MSPLLHRPYWYLRHGQTDWNVLNLSQGRTDIPLNNTGIKQAITAGNALARNWNNLELSITQIISSPLGRARRTADIVKSIIHDKVGDGHVLIIAHGGVFRSLRYMMGLKPNVRLANAQPLCACPPFQGGKSWSLDPVSLEA